MSAPYPIGSRVVCPKPDDGWFVGTVLDVYDGVDLLVSDGVLTTRRLASEVRPVMPRDRADLERWGRWWHLDDRIVEVFGFDRYGNIAMYAAGTGAPQYLSSVHNWRGPVQPPPVVRG